MVFATAAIAAGTMVAATPAAFAGAQTCAKSVVVTDQSQLLTAIDQVCAGGTVNIAPTMTVVEVSQIVIDKAVKIHGAGQATTTIYVYGSADGGVQVTSTGALDLSDATLSGQGTGIQVAGSLKLSYVTVTRFFPTAIWALPGSSVKLTRGTLITANGSGYYDWPGGAGIYNDGGTVVLNGNAAVRDNVNYGCYSVVMSDGRRTPPLGGLGGGIFSTNNGSITLNDQATVSGNTIRYCDTTKGPGPTGWGGGIYAASGSVTLNGSASVTGNGAAHGGGIATGGTLTGLSQSASVILNQAATVSGNLATSNGGGIFNWINGQVTMNQAATVSDNESGNGGGGGIYNISGTVTMTGSSLITGNSTYGSGGGVLNTSFSSGSISYPQGVLALIQSAAVAGNTPDDIAP